MPPEPHGAVSLHRRTQSQSTKPASMAASTSTSNKRATAARRPRSSHAGPSLFTAVREQLGLKLEPSKGPVPFLVKRRKWKSEFAFLWPVDNPLFLTASRYVGVIGEVPTSPPDTEKAAS